MELLTPPRFEDPVHAYGYVRTLFDEVAAGLRGGTVSITPSSRHVGVTRRDTTRPGFGAAVRAANVSGFPVLVRGAGGGATAADAGTFGFSIIRPAEGDVGRSVYDRYDEAASLALAAFARLGLEAEVGEVRDEFCPGDHSIRVGGPEGMKLAGIAQRVTRRATSVGGLVLVSGEERLAPVLEGVYAAMDLPFRSGSVGSLRRAGFAGGVEDVIEALAAEVGDRYGAERVGVGDDLLLRARRVGRESLVVARGEDTFIGYERR